MPITAKDLASFAKVCKAHGIKELCVGEVKLVMDLSHKQDTLIKEPQSVSGNPVTVGGVSEESVLFWSVQGPPGEEPLK